LIRFAELTATGGAITAFFNVLTGLLNALNTFLAIPAVKAAFDFLSKIFATLSAAGLAFSAATFAFKVLAGNILFAVRAIGILIGKQALATVTTAGLTTKLRALAISGVQGAIKGIGALAAAIGGSLLTAFKALGAVIRANPLGLLITVLSLIAVGFATLYTKSEGFRNFVDGIAQKISSAFGGVIDFLKRNWPMILAILTGPIGLAVLAISRNWDSIIAFARSIPARMSEALRNLWSGLTDGLKNAWNNAKAWWNANVASKKLKIGGAVIAGRTLPSFELGFPSLAEGGIVYPRSGGTMARVAEAGRPERVEPLDPDGLSKRDKAMIKLLSSGQGGGMTVNVYPSPGMDETELASLVSRQIAFSLRRGGA
jgi:phage-related protein